MNSPTQQNPSQADKNKKPPGVPEKKTDHAQAGHSQADQSKASPSQKDSQKDSHVENKTLKPAQTNGRSNQINTNSTAEKKSSENNDAQEDNDEDGISSRTPIMKRSDDQTNNKRQTEMDNL